MGLTCIENTVTGLTYGGEHGEYTAHTHILQSTNTEKRLKVVNDQERACVCACVCVCPEPRQLLQRM